MSPVPPVPVPPVPVSPVPSSSAPVSSAPVPGRLVRWGILGAGAIAGRFARDLAHVPDSAVAAVYARRPEAAQALATAHAAKAVSTPAALFASGIDAVYIATLPDTHHAFARAALEAGLPVLCEKPVTRSLAELDSLLALAAARDLLFMEAMKTPFLPLFRALREHLAPQPGPGSSQGGPGSTQPPPQSIQGGQGSDSPASGPLGPITFVQAGNASPATPPDHPSWSATLAGGALMAIGVYQAFLAVDWLGPATSTQALAQMSPAHPGPGPVDSFTVVQSQHERGFSQLYAGLALASPGTATVSGPLGFATVHKPWWNPSRATVTPLSGPPVELHHPVLGDGLHYETAHFCDLLRAGLRESPIVTHAHSRAVMALLDQARAAIGLRFPAARP